MTEELYAAYFDVVQSNPIYPTRYLRRWQWILLPKSTPNEVPVFVLWSREQRHFGHRAKWTHETISGDPVSFLYNYDRATKRDGAIVNPPLVVPITATELRFYSGYSGGPMAKYNTPWKIIERAEKLAPKLGFVVKYPTT